MLIPLIIASLIVFTMSVLYAIWWGYFSEVKKLKNQNSK